MWGYLRKSIIFIEHWEIPTSKLRRDLNVFRSIGIKGDVKLHFNGSPYRDYQLKQKI
jgi:hypothetical protein